MLCNAFSSKIFVLRTATVTPAAANQQQVPGQLPIIIDAGRRRRRRLARDIVIAAMVNPDLFDSDDDDDNDGDDGEDFDAESDSDEYRPGRDIDDEDNEDDDDEEEEEEEEINFRVLRDEQNEE